MRCDQHVMLPGARMTAQYLKQVEMNSVDLIIKVIASNPRMLFHRVRRPLSK